MIILGDSSQHKGKQLESLTRRLLEARKYGDLHVNVIASGSELDVTGNFDLPGLSGAITHKVICECKAIQAPVDMTQWCKFLGKLYHYEKTENDRYIGCFVALSGVNGYVQGNYDSLKGNEKIQLLTGDTLTNVVVDFYKSINRSQVAAILNASTDRIIRQTDLTLYNDSLFWSVQLSDTEFTVVGGDGKLWSNTSDASKICELLSAELSGSRFVDLNEENRAIQRRKNVASVLLAVAITSKGEKAELRDFPKIKDITLDELKDAAKRLHEDGHLEYWEYNGKVRLPINRKNGLPVMSLEVWRIIHDGQVQLFAYDSKFSDELLNDDFLNDVSALQGHLPIPAERRPIWIKILRLCCDAVKLLVNPIPELMQHRNQQPHPSVVDALDRMDLTTVERRMMSLLAFDYRKPNHGEFFKRKHGILEMETAFNLKVKTGEGMLLESSATERHVLAELDSSLGGGYHPILLRPDAPEPWDHEAVAKFLQSNEPSMSEPVPNDGSSIEKLPEPPPTGTTISPG